MNLVESIEFDICHLKIQKRKRSIEVSWVGIRIQIKMQSLATSSKGKTSIKEDILKLMSPW